jgi:4a-hydroxytetrahydrobiopterin dehydratase
VSGRFFFGTTWKFCYLRLFTRDTSASLAFSEETLMPGENPRDRQLKSERIQSRITTLPGWELGDDSITRSYTLPNFRSALAFVQYVGELAEARDHHPDIDVRYSKVTLTLSTHSAGGLTEKDFELAALIDSRPKG